MISILCPVSGSDSGVRSPVTGDISVETAGTVTFLIPGVETFFAKRGSIVLISDSVFFSI